MLNKKKHGSAKYKAGIIGAGRIASGFDAPAKKEILTHAHAYMVHPQTNLVGFVDINKETARAAGKKWLCSAFTDLEAMFREVKPDIVSICTPDENHFSILTKVNQYKPRLVICEKPATTDVQKTKEVLNLYKKTKTPLLINYSRRFDKKIQKLRKEIQSAKYGKILSACGIYTKGILHNGSHLIDLCRYFFGEVVSFRTEYAISDYRENDKSVAGFIKFEKCPCFHLMVGDCRKYSIFELDILLEKKRFRFFNSGLNISIQKVIKDPFLKGFFDLGKPIVNKTFLTRAQLALVDNAVGHLERKEPLICDIHDALKTQEVCELLLKDWRK